MFGMSQKLLWELKNFQLPGDSYFNRTSILAPAAPVARLVSRGGARREIVNAVRNSQKWRRC